MLTGMSLVQSVWAAIGVLVVFAAVVLIIVKFFLGSGRNIAQGFMALAGVAVLAALAAKPDVVISVGDTALGILGLH